MLSFFPESDLTLAYIVSSDMAGSTDDRAFDESIQVALADLIYETCITFELYLQTCKSRFLLSQKCV